METEKPDPLPRGTFQFEMQCNACVMLPIKAGSAGTDHGGWRAAGELGSQVSRMGKSTKACQAGKAGSRGKKPWKRRGQPCLRRWELSDSVSTMVSFSVYTVSLLMGFYLASPLRGQCHQANVVSGRKWWEWMTASGQGPGQAFEYCAQACGLDFVHHGGCCWVWGMAVTWLNLCSG